MEGDGTEWKLSLYLLKDITRLRDGSGRVGFWKILPDPLGFGSRRVRALSKPVPLGLGRVKPENPTELTGDDDEVESKNFHIL